MKITELTWREGQPDWSHWKGWQAGVHQLRGHPDGFARPDLIHAGNQGPALAAALAEFPLVSMSWAFDLLRNAGRSPWMRRITQYVLDRSAVLVADCQTVADRVAGYRFPRQPDGSSALGCRFGSFSPERAREVGQALKHDLGWQEQFVLFATVPGLCPMVWMT